MKSEHSPHRISVKDLLTKQNSSELDDAIIEMQTEGKNNNPVTEVPRSNRVSTNRLLELTKQINEV